MPNVDQVQIASITSVLKRVYYSVRRLIQQSRTALRSSITGSFLRQRQLLTTSLNPHQNIYLTLNTNRASNGHGITALPENVTQNPRHHFFKLLCALAVLRVRSSCQWHDRGLPLAKHSSGTRKLSIKVNPAV